MVILDNRFYRQTKAMLLGQRKAPKLLTEFSEWMQAKYSVRMINYRLKKSIPRSNRYILSVILATKADYDRMHDSLFITNKNFQRQIAEKFREIKSADQRLRSKDLRELLVSFIDFSMEAKTETNWKAAPACSEIYKI